MTFYFLIPTIFVHWKSVELSFLPHIFINFLSFFFKFYFIFKLYITVLVLPNIKFYRMHF